MKERVDELSEAAARAERAHAAAARELGEARAELADQELARAGVELPEHQAEHAVRLAELDKAQSAVDAARREVATSVEAVLPEPKSDLVIAQTVDVRPTYVAVAMGAIALFFTALMLGLTFRDDADEEVVTAEAPAE
jgi:hypothetical protein